MWGAHHGVHLTCIHPRWEAAEAESPVLLQKGLGLGFEGTCSRASAKQHNRRGSTRLDSTHASATMSLRPDRKDRKGTFKKTIDVEDARRKREDNIVELRKSKRDENLQKKRMVFAAGHDSSAMEDSTRNGGATMQQKVRNSCIRLLQPCAHSCTCRANEDACQAF